MIQPISPSMQPGSYSTPVSEDIAYQTWILRRDAARQQIRRLSRRELEVVQLVSAGLANKSIALELKISVKTIEKHRANAARKLNVNSTAEMVRLAVQADHEMPEGTRIDSSTYYGTLDPVMAGH